MVCRVPDHATLAEEQAGLATLVRQLDARSSVADSQPIVDDLAVRPHPHDPRFSHFIRAVLYRTGASRLPHESASS